MSNLRPETNQQIEDLVKEENLSDYCQSRIQMIVQSAIVKDRLNSFNREVEELVSHFHGGMGR